jgi:multiple sugar transport system substrate-binding protein/raffinose/stachyose/melibiose transport system substrate-binding protein
MPITFLTDHTSPLMRGIDERIVREWNARRLDIQVNLVTLDHEEFRDQLPDLLAQENPPDVLTWFAGNRMRELTDRMRDVATMWDDEGFTAAYPQRFRRMAGDAGAATFLPTSHYWWAVYYRPTVFVAHGLRDPIETWDDLAEAARVLRAGGVAPFALGARHRCPAAAWFDYLNMRLNGPAFHGELMALTAGYDDPRVRAVFDFWRSLIDEGWFLGEPAEYDEDEAAAAVLDGRAAMTLMGAYIADEYVPPGEPDLDFFRFPIIDPTIPVGEDAPVDGYFVAGNSAYPQQATQFLAHLGSPDVQRHTVEAMSVLPTHDGVDIAKASRHVAAGGNLLRAADQVHQFYDLDTPAEFATHGMDAFVAFLRDPDSAGRLLEALETRRQRLVAQRR